MGEQEQVREGRAFGTYLRRIREERRLSLDSVEEMSFGFPERVTKSHLSRIENGLAVPSFPRMFTLSQIYGIPVSLMADRFETELKRGMADEELKDKTDEELETAATTLRKAGRYPEVLTVIDALLERRFGGLDAPVLTDDHALLRCNRVQCLIHLGRYRLAKEECEELLGRPLLEKRTKVEVLHAFARCCLQLERHTVASMALDHAEREIESGGVPSRMKADLAMIRGLVYQNMGNMQESLDPFRRAFDEYTHLIIPFEACRARINMTSSLLELGSYEEARKLLLLTLAESEEAGYDRLRALVLSNLALLSFKLADEAAAEAYCIRSNAIARPREYVQVLFRNCYYLWKIAQSRGDRHAQKANERTLKAILGRLEMRLPEADAFRASFCEGKP